MPLNQSDFDQFAFIIGAMKSGTTALFSYLAQHPAICPCQKKEPNFFSHDPTFNKGLAWYKSLWDWDPQIHKLALEASTGYTNRFVHVNTKAVKRMISSTISAKFIYIIRHPIHRIESQLKMNYAKGWKTFNENGFVHPDLITLSCYFTQISEYLKCFPKEKILLLRFENFIRNPVVTLNHVCNFLEIDSDFQFQIPGQRIHEGTIYALTSNSFLAALLNLCPQKIQKTAYSVLPKIMKNIIRQFALSLSAKSVRLTEKHKEQILREIRDDMEKLQSELDFDIGPWGLDNESV